MQFDISFISPYLILIYALSAILIFLVIWIMQLEKKIKNFRIYYLIYEEFVAMFLITISS